MMLPEACRAELEGRGQHHGGLGLHNVWPLGGIFSSVPRPGVWYCYIITALLFSQFLLVTIPVHECEGCLSSSEARVHAQVQVEVLGLVLGSESLRRPTGIMIGIIRSVYIQHKSTSWIWCNFKQHLTIQVIQGNHSCCSQPSLDIKTKAMF